MIKTCNCILWKRCARWIYFYTIVARGRESHTRTNWKGNARHLCDFYWRMINLQKSLVDSISNFCSAQQWSCSSFAFMCIVSPSISWEGLTTRLQRMEHRSLVLFNHRHQKGSHLIPCKGFVDQNKQEAGGNVFSGGDNSLYSALSSCWLNWFFLAAYETDFIIYQILLFFFGNNCLLYTAIKLTSLSIAS